MDIVHLICPYDPAPRCDCFFLHIVLCRFQFQRRGQALMIYVSESEVKHLHTLAHLSFSCFWSGSIGKSVQQAITVWESAFDRLPDSACMKKGGVGKKGCGNEFGVVVRSHSVIVCKHTKWPVLTLQLELCVALKSVVFVTHDVKTLDWMQQSFCDKR